MIKLNMVPDFYFRKGYIKTFAVFGKNENYGQSYGVAYWPQNPVVELIDIIGERDWAQYLPEWTEKEGLIKILDGRHTKEIKPGRLIKKLWPSYNDKDIKEISQQLDAINPLLADARQHEQTSKLIKFAYNTIHIVYKKSYHGARSCMAGIDREQWGNHIPSDRHPCEVYNGTGIAIIYIKDSNGHVVERTLANVEKKLYVRVYNSGSELLEQWLIREGYQRSDNALDGFVLNRIEFDGVTMMPYIDGHGRIDRDTLTITPNGGYSTQNHNHHIYGVIRNRFAICDHCGCEIDEDDSEYINLDGNVYCSHDCAHADGWEFAYTYRYETWTQDTVYYYRSEAYTREGLYYYDLTICDQCGGVFNSREEGHCFGVNNFCSDSCLRHSGYDYCDECGEYYHKAEGCSCDNTNQDGSEQ